MDADQKDPIVNSGSGDQGNPSVVGDAPGKSKDEPVSYDSYKRALDDVHKLKRAKKEAEERIKLFEQAEREREQKYLEEQGNYKKLLEQERERVKALEQDRDSFKNEIILSHKLSAFKEKLPGKLASNEYYSFVPHEEILVDPETNTIDEASVESVVKSFVERHSRLIEGRKGSLPDNAPRSKTALTYNEWLKLPAKEKRERLPEIMSKDG